MVFVVSEDAMVLVPGRQTLWEYISDMRLLLLSSMWYPEKDEVIL
jgi:hypothetical protein